MGGMDDQKCHNVCNDNTQSTPEQEEQLPVHSLQDSGQSCRQSPVCAPPLVGAAPPARDPTSCRSKSPCQSLRWDTPKWPEMQRRECRQGKKQMGESGGERRGVEGREEKGRGEKRRGGERREGEGREEEGRGEEREMKEEGDRWREKIREGYLVLSCWR